MIQYRQHDGQITIDGKFQGFGYSGNGLGLNNPALEAEQDVGCIPAGAWEIERWDAHHGDKGPNVAVLNPVGHDAHGRSAFLIHGDNSLANHSASHGCIIAGPTIRDALHKSGQTQILVVP